MRSRPTPPCTSRSPAEPWGSRPSLPWRRTLCATRSTGRVCTSGGVTSDSCRPAIRTPEESAEAYAAELARFAPDGSSVPPFDVLMLGTGPDGHVASLFPGHDELAATGVPTVGVH